MSDQDKDKVIAAVSYAMRTGALSAVRMPTRGSTLNDWIRWGAMRHLHDVWAEVTRSARIEETR